MQEDPRIKRWAYVTDGVDLYEVGKQVREGGFMAQKLMVELENCRTLKTMKVEAGLLTSRKFTLVRAAPREDAALVERAAA